MLPAGGESRKDAAITLTCDVQDLADQAPSFKWIRSGKEYTTIQASIDAGYSITYVPNKKCIIFLESAQLSLLKSDNR